VLGLLLLSAAVVAGTVVVNGRSVRCQNTCVVGVTRSGGWYVYDSGGGSMVETTNKDLAK
jgi:hypothetical protein